MRSHWTCFFFYLILKLLALLSVTSLQTTALGVVKPVQSAPLTYTLSVTTRGSGFHRSLQYNFGSTRDCQSLGDSAALSSGVAVLQPLPAGIFADVYQLQGAAAQGKGPDIKYFGFVDVESIELYGQPTILTSYHYVAPALVWDSKGKCFASFVSKPVPLHARYPLVTVSDLVAHGRDQKEQGVEQRKNFVSDSLLHQNQVPAVLSKSWWQAIFRKSFRTYTLQSPLLLFHDKYSIEADTTQLNVSCVVQSIMAATNVNLSNCVGSRWLHLSDDVQHHLHWKVPAGNVELYDFIAHVTVTCLLLGAFALLLYILWAIPCN